MDHQLCRQWCAILHGLHGLDLGVLFTGVMLSNRNLVRTWAGLLLSASVWMQVAAMGGFKASVIIKHMQAAVRLACARTSHNHVPSEQWVHTSFIAHKLLLHRNEVLVLLHGWLRTNAYWAGGGYTSWHVPHANNPHSPHQYVWMVVPGR